jgi:hypothetical protein
MKHHLNLLLRVRKGVATQQLAKKMGHDEEIPPSIIPGMNFAVRFKFEIFNNFQANRAIRILAALAGFDNGTTIRFGTPCLNDRPFIGRHNH